MNEHMTSDTNTIDNCIEEITNSLHKLEDPDQLQNVHRWVIKLTTGEPSVLKADYLRLLEYTLKSGELREPFDSPPPEGRLPGLNELARRPSSSYGTEERTRRALAAGGSSTDPRRARDCPGNDKKGPPDACPELVGLIDQTNSQKASLQRFMADAQRYTCDGGQVMAEVCVQMMDDYLQSAEAMFEDRARNVGDALAKEQVVLLLRYRNAKQRMISRAQIMLDHVSELMPKFIYSEYITEPDAYMKRLIVEKNNEAASKRSANNSSSPSEDPENDVEHNKLLAALVWLRSEVDRADCENVTLVDRFETVVATIDQSNRKRTANECQAKERRNELRCELDALRKKSTEQVTLIDSYVEQISAEKTVVERGC